MATLGVDGASSAGQIDHSPEPVIFRLEQPVRIAERLRTEYRDDRMNAGPEAWGHTEEGRDAIVDGVTKEFRDSGTINTVVVHWEIWSPVPGPPYGAVRRGERLLVIGSGRARVELDALDTALMHVVDEEDIQWLSLHALLCS